MTSQQSDSWKDSLLFSPFRVGVLQLKNRIVYPPIHTNMDMTESQARAYYRERAKGGAGLIIVEVTPVSYFDDPRFASGVSGLAEVIHQEGVPAVIQLFQTPRVNGEAVSVSGEREARAATTQEVAAIPAHFARAAVLAREAGFDGVEIHGAHGYFLNQFFSPVLNRRRDKYGGSLEGRMRLALECTRAVREAVGPRFPLFYRHTPVADYSVHDSLALVRELERAGLDVIDVSPSTTQGSREHADLAAAVKKAVAIPVIAVGGMEDPSAGEAVLERGKADLVAIGRALIADPSLPLKILQGRPDEIIRCIKCDERCVGRLETGIPIGCTQNPKTGLEYEAE